MNNYQTKHIVQTFSNVMISGLLASTFLSPACTDEPFSTAQPYTTTGYNYTLAAEGTPLTYESSRNLQARGHSSSVEIETVVTNFFSELSSNQEVLGSEFEQILLGNLWDLYQS